jgi:hypothetical protein
MWWILVVISVSTHKTHIHESHMCDKISLMFSAIMVFGFMGIIGMLGYEAYANKSEAYIYACNTSIRTDNQIKWKECFEDCNTVIAFMLFRLVVKLFSILSSIAVVVYLSWIVIRLIVLIIRESFIGMLFSSIEQPQLSLISVRRKPIID